MSLSASWIPKLCLRCVVDWSFEQWQVSRLQVSRGRGCRQGFLAVPHTPRLCLTRLVILYTLAVTVQASLIRDLLTLRYFLLLPYSAAANKCHRLWTMSLPICSVCYRWINITYYHVTLLILCISTYYVGISSDNLVKGIIIQLLLVPRLFCTPQILFAITQ